MTDRTARWQRELEYLAQTAQDDYRPSIREIASAVGAANQTVMNDLAELVRRGLVGDCDVPAGRKQGRVPWSGGIEGVVVNLSDDAEAGR